MNVKYTFARRLTQILVLAALIIIAIQFIRFVIPLTQGRLPVTERPPGVEAFLPISALVSLKYWFVTGHLNQVHPSAVLILGFALIVSLLVKKSLCSWVCPIGFFSEMVFLVKKTCLGDRFAMPRVLDIMLRSLKYLSLFGFVYIILLRMGGRGLEGFIFSASHIVADVKMLDFFVHMSPRALGIFAGLFLLSFVFPFFWCRYLCPYGALAGLFGMLSPVRIRRNKETCTGCGSCSRACPVRIRVSERPAVRSDLCTSCGRCADACPRPGTLALAAPGRKHRAVPAFAVAVMVIVVFLGGDLAARSFGVWQNGVSGSSYLSAMLETGLLDLSRVKDRMALIRKLDTRGKRALMAQMFGGGHAGPGAMSAPGSMSSSGAMPSMRAK